MPATLRAPEDRMNEPFRDKVIRKCEVHATAVHIIWDLVHIALGEEDVT